MKITNVNVKKMIMMGAISTSLALTTASCGNYNDTTSTNVGDTITKEVIDDYNDTTSTNVKIQYKEVIDEKQIREDEALEYFKKQLVTNGDLGNTYFDEKKWKYDTFGSNKAKDLFAYVDNEVLSNVSYSSTNSEIELVNQSNYGNLKFKKINIEFIHSYYVRFCNDSKYRIYYGTGIEGNHAYYEYHTYSNDCAVKVIYHPYTSELKIIHGVLQQYTTYTIPANKNLDMMKQLLRLYNQNIGYDEIINNKDKIANCEYAIIENSNKNSNSKQTVTNNSKSSNSKQVATDNSKNNASDDINNPYNKFISIFGESNVQTKNIDKEVINTLVNEINPNSSELKKALPNLINKYLQASENMDDSIKNIKENKSFNFYFNDNYVYVDANQYIYEDENYGQISLSNMDMSISIDYIDNKDKEKKAYSFKNVVSNYTLLYYPYKKNNNLSIYRNGEFDFFEISTEMQDALTKELFKCYENNTTYYDMLSHITDISNGIEPSNEKVYSKR